MPFEIIPLLKPMLEFYQNIPAKIRFKEYLFLLQGETNDMILPIGNYNPMGNELVIEKIKNLIESNAEEILQEQIDKISKRVEFTNDRNLRVGINVCDDLGGAWSQIYTTDYSSKFHQSILLKRDFCTPIFWVSRKLSSYEIGIIIQEYLLRSIYFLLSGQVFTLQDHVDQELFVAKHTERDNMIIQTSNSNFEIEAFYKEHKESNDHSIIFNFFYGDEASKLLGYKCHGIKRTNGFEYVNQLIAR